MRHPFLRPLACLLPTLAILSSAPAASLPNAGNLSLQLDASTLDVGDGNPVANWGGLAASGLEQPTLNHTGLNGMPSVTFNGTTNFMRQNGVNLNGQTIYAVITLDSDAPNLAGLLSNGGDMLNVRRDGTTQFYRADGFNGDGNDFVFGGSVRVNNALNAALTYSTPHIYTGESNGTQTFGNIMLGQANPIGGAAGRFWKGEVAEILIYDSIFSAKNNSYILGYFNEKYGLEVPGYDSHVLAGNTVTASIEKVGEEASKAFDGNTGTKWFASNQTNPNLTVQFDGTQIAMDRYLLSTANDVPARDPKDWNILGSNDGENWDTLDSRSGITWSSRFETQTFSFANDTPYEYYRLDILANHGDGNTQLSEWQLLDIASAVPEPSHYAIALGLAGMIFAALRRRK